MDSPVLKLFYQFQGSLETMLGAYRTFADKVDGRYSEEKLPISELLQNRQIDPDAMAQIGQLLTYPTVEAGYKEFQMLFKSGPPVSLTSPKMVCSVSVKLAPLAPFTLAVWERNPATEFCTMIGPLLKNIPQLKDAGPRIGNETVMELWDKFQLVKETRTGSTEIDARFQVRCDKPAVIRLVAEDWRVREKLIGLGAVPVFYMSGRLSDVMDGIYVSEIIEVRSASPLSSSYECIKACLDTLLKLKLISPAA